MEIKGYKLVENFLLQVLSQILDIPQTTQILRVSKTTVCEKEIGSLKMTYLFDFFILQAQMIRFQQKNDARPYITHHINRFGKYKLDLDRKPPDIVYDFRNFKKI